MTDPTISQDARNAAADFIKERGALANESLAVREGRNDGHYMVQTFAAFEARIEAKQTAAVGEAVERCAALADRAAFYAKLEGIKVENEAQAKTVETILKAFAADLRATIEKEPKQ